MKRSRVWAGRGQFPPGGWSGSPYRFLRAELPDGAKVEADFWRELIHVKRARGRKWVSFGARLKPDKSKCLTVTVWLPRAAEATLIEAIEAAARGKDYNFEVHGDRG